MPGAPRRRLLTDAELELMSTLWDHGPGTVRQTLGRLGEGRAPAYTTVSTILRILVDKGFATATPQGRTHVYAATIDRQGYQGRSLRQLVGGLFGGNPVELVRRLVDSDDVTEADLRALQALVDQELSE